MAGTGAAMRYERVAMLNIGTELSPDYTLMGPGFETLDDALNPEVDETTYISDVSATKTITAYAPEWSFDGSVLKDDDVIAFLREIGSGLKTGSDAETSVVVFDAWDAVANVVPAVKFMVAVQMDSIASGSGGEKLGFSGSLLGQGDPITGEFDITTSTFTPDVS